VSGPDTPIKIGSPVAAVLELAAVVAAVVAAVASAVASAEAGVASAGALVATGAAGWLACGVAGNAQEDNAMAERTAKDRCLGENLTLIFWYPQWVSRRDEARCKSLLKLNADTCLMASV
jgi:hypothetical protein